MPYHPTKGVREYYNLVLLLDEYSMTEDHFGLVEGQDQLKALLMNFHQFSQDAYSHPVKNMSLHLVETHLKFISNGIQRELKDYKTAILSFMLSQFL